MNTEEDLKLARRLAEGIAARGGRVYFVGGCVRDRFTGTPLKDVDVEVYGVTPRELREVLSALGTVVEKGAAFGVLGLEHSGLDVAMPRKESRTGELHTDFDVSVDPFLSTREASRRRDFTCNALMEDVLTGEIVDHWHGREDLAGGVLRMVCRETFGEDALRAFRGAQFAARLGARIEPETMAVCRSVDVTHLSRERIYEETVKALMKAERPSVYFRALREMDHLREFFPELEAASEKKVLFGEIMQSVDGAAALRQEAEWALALMFAALCSRLEEAEEKSGGKAAEKQMRRLTNQTPLIRYVENMAELHPLPGELARSGADRTESREMFDGSVCPGDLLLLYRAEHPEEDGTAAFLTARLQDYRETVGKPMVTGKDLQGAGIAPGPGMGALLRRTRHLHFAGLGKEEALAQVLREHREGQEHGKAQEE